MRKERLMTPGPTEVPPEVLLEMSKPIFHHRTDRYRELFKEVTEGLQYVFQTKNPVVTFASSGTGAMEAAVTNLLSTGEKALVVRGGKFGERFGEICEKNGVQVVPIDVEWGRAVSPETIAKHLQDDADIAAVFTTLCETSTGVETDIKSIGEIVKQHKAVLVVDGISSVGAVEMRTDEWGVDMLVVGSQKALMLPPGLAFISVSEKARRKIESNEARAYYFDLLKAMDKLTDSDTPYTPAVSLVRGLAVSLRMLKEEGIENVWKRHALMARACREAMTAMGLRILPERPSNGLTVVCVPDGVDGSAITRELASNYGIRIAGGQEQLKGKVFRIAHMGYMDRFDIITVVAALEMLLNKLGYAVEPGVGVAAAEKVFMSES